MSVNAMSLMAGTTNKDVEQGRVLCLMNMITPEELMDHDEADGEFLLFLLLRFWCGKVAHAAASLQCFRDLLTDPNTFANHHRNPRGRQGRMCQVRLCS